MPLSNTIGVPTLGVAGWVNSGLKKIDTLLSHFFIANYSQSYVSQGNISSLPKILQQYAQDMPGLCSALSSKIEDYLKRYYPEGASCTASTDDITAGSVNNVLTLSLTILYVENGTQYSAGSVVNVSGSKFINIVTENNEGTTT